MAFTVHDFARHAAYGLRYAAITAMLGAMHLTGAARLATDRLRGRGVIFTLHHVRPFAHDAFHASAHLEITPEFLDALIRHVRARDYEPIPLAEVPARLAAPDGGSRFVAFTLDDGYRDNLVHARPVFERHGVPFTVFATSGFVTRERTVWWLTLERIIARVRDLWWDTGDRRLHFSCAGRHAKAMTFRRVVDWMNSVDEDWAITTLDRVAVEHGVSATAVVDEEVMNAAELRELAASPMATIGAHTWSHVNLRRVSQDRLVEDIERGVAEVAAILGRRPTVFAYPYGSHASAGVREFAAARGFDLAVTTEPGTLSAADLDRLTALPRISVNGHYQRTAWIEVLMSGLPFELIPHRAELD
ncbi:MAG: polysaccharide deacetylase family protein [Siculibacillus sp.]|nr:polysaccharide deacetylase family protein [Siculibacillus sp.]